jgi:hypothetical protein
MLHNRLHVQIVQAVLQIRYGLEKKGESCATFTPSDDVIQHFYDKDAGCVDEDDDDVPGIPRISPVVALHGQFQFLDA